MTAEFDFIALLDGFAARVDNHAAKVIATADRDAIARSASALAACRGELGEVEASLKQAIPGLVAFGEKPIVEGLGEVKVRSGTKRRAYQKPELTERAVARIADEPEHFNDPETGEQRPRADVVRRVVTRFSEFFGLAAPKKTGFDAAGIDIDDFCEVEKGKATVQLPSSRGRSPVEVGGDVDEGF